MIARQKIFGLGYSLLVFVYEKADDRKSKSAILNFLHTVFVEKEQTADFQMTTGLLQILEDKGNAEDLSAFMMDKNLPVEEIEATKMGHYSEKAYQVSLVSRQKSPPERAAFLLCEFDLLFNED